MSCERQHRPEGRLSHAEGRLSHADGRLSHAERRLSHAEGGYPMQREGYPMQSDPQSRKPFSVWWQCEHHATMVMVYRIYCASLLRMLSSGTASSKCCVLGSVPACLLQLLTLTLACIGHRTPQSRVDFVVPHARTATRQNRAFSIVGPYAWDSLPSAWDGSLWPVWSFAGHVQLL